MYIKQYLEDNNISIYKVANDAMVAYPTVFNIVNGKVDILNCALGVVKKIADALECEVDYKSIDFIDQNYYEARLGICKANGITTRINYWPVILGTVDIDEGEHDITIYGSENKLNIGGIYIFDNATAGGLNGFED